MDHVTATSPNWVVESGSPNSANSQAVEKPTSEWEIEDQPRPEQIILFDNLSGTQEEVDKVKQEEQSELSENAMSSEKDIESDVSVEKNLLLTDDGEGIGGNDDITITKHVDKDGEQEMGEQTVPLVENVPLPEQEKLQESKEESNQENFVMKQEGDDGKTGQPEEAKLEQEKMTKQDSHLLEHQPSTGEQLIDQKTEGKIEENHLVTEDVHDGKKYSRRQEVHKVEQEEKPRQETQSVENPPAADEQLSNQKAEESIEQKLSGLSLQETEQRNELTFHAEAELKKDKDSVLYEETEQKKDSSFQETGAEGEDETAQPVGLENVDQLTQGNEVVMEEEKVPVSVEEEKIPVAVEEEKIPVAVEEEKIPVAVEEEKIPLAIVDEKIPVAVEEEKIPVAVEVENVPVAVEEEKVLVAVEQEMVPVAGEQENTPVAVEKENASEAMEQESSPIIVEEENVPVDMEEDVQAEIVQTTRVPESETSREIIDMEPKDVIPQPAAVASVGEHVSQSAEIKESSETKEEESQNEETVVTPVCDPVEEVVSSANSASNESASPVVISDVQVSSPTPPTALPISSSSPSSKVENTPPGDMLHHIKNIQFKDKNVGIVTQNENGPCPLVAIINVLLLRRQITLPAHSEIVSAAKLMEYIGDAMLGSVPKNLSGEIRLNYEQNMHDAMAVLPKLQTGLDVNVKFTGVRDFEYTPECIIFDLLRIPLFHGWLVDPETPEVVAAVGQAGYNQLVEKVISQKCSSDENAVLEALVIENFLERSASQLTYHGLSELTTSMEDDEIGVLFRNNHFSTIYKRQKELLQLVTDQGFLGESSVVWETLGSIDGDGQFVDSHFRTVPPKPELAPSGDSASPNTSAQLTAEQQIDHDFLVALSLQEEQQQEQPAAAPEEVAREVGEDVAKTLAEDDKTTQELMDLELARQLQQEEERQAAEAETVERETAAASSQSPPAAGQRSPPPSQSSKKKDCTFL